MGVGEVDDARAIHDFIRTKHPDVPLILAGFSFGTSVVSQLAAKVSYKQLILIGPAVSRYPVIVTDSTKTCVIHGEEDEVIPLTDVLDWGRSNNQPIIWFPNTGHFFHGKLIGLTNLLNQLV
jgi:alpha/beta superfamily hydrolase